MKATYRITETAEARRLLAPMHVGQRMHVAVVREGASVYAARCVSGTVVQTDGFNAVVAYDLPAGHYAL